MTTPPRVLIVEDEAIVAEDIAHIVGRLGYTPVGPFATGEEALAEAAAADVDIALMDIHLAGKMDGIETARELLARDVGVIFLTAFADDETVARAKLSTPYGYIVKPFNDRDVKTALEVALYKRRAELELARQRRLLEAIVGGASDAIIGLDATAQVSFLNPAAQELLKMSTEEACGRPLADVLHLEGRGSTGLDRAIESAVTNGVARRIPSTTRTRPSAGAAVAVDGALSPILGSGGKPNGAVLLLRDRAREARIEALEVEIQELQRGFQERLRQLV